MPPETLLTALHESLPACVPIGSDASLQDLFADPRLAPWRDKIPGACTRAARFDALIAALGRSQRNDGKAALILLLEVFADRTDPADACREHLLSLASQYAAIAHVGGTVVVAGPLPDLLLPTAWKVTFALHGRYGTSPPPLPDLLRQLGKLFRRNTFCESPRVCLKQLWTERLCATLEMLDVLAAYEGYLEEQAAHYRAGGTRVDKALALLAALEPAVRAYAHALTNFFRTEVEVDAARERLRARQGDTWKELLDVARLDHAAIPAEAMELCSRRFEVVQGLVQGLPLWRQMPAARHARRHGQRSTRMTCAMEMNLQRC